MKNRLLKDEELAPDFTLPNSKEQKITLSSFKKNKNVVLYFYPKDMTPGCTTESSDFSSHIEEFKKLETEILGISFDDPKKHQKFIDKYQLKQTLLSDEEKKVAKAYGVYQQKMLYGKKFMGIVRSTFIIGKDGKIKKIFPKVKVKDHWKEVLDFIKGK